MRYRCLVLKSSDIALSHPSNQVFITSPPQLSLPGYMLSDRLSIKRWTGAYYQAEHYSDWPMIDGAHQTSHTPQSSPQLSMGCPALFQVAELSAGEMRGPGGEQ